MGLSNILVPVFFTVMGMLVDLRSFSEPSVAALTLVFTLAAAAAKVLGCGVPAMFSGFNALGAARIGVGMLPRGEVALIIAGIGLASGALDQAGFSIVVMMTLITTLAAPPMLVSLFTIDRSGTRRVDERKINESVTVDFPSEDVADLIWTRLADVFQQDGFFVHVLENHLFQIRKDTTVISLETKGQSFTFRCAQKDIPFVHTAVYEVLADIDRISKALREPIDRKSLAKGVQEAVQGAGTGLSLKEKLSPELLIPELKGRTKAEIIDELISAIEKAGKLIDAGQVRKAVWAREESMSTGMQFGVAIPHGRTDAVPSMVCAVGLKKDGVDWDSLDGLPARIFVMVLSPQSQSGPHIRFLSTISQVLNEEGRDGLIKCGTSIEMYEALTGRKG
jgi:mannitol/fructose-specific phosphotransferase system IIA component (Ntr-type)